MVTSTSSSAVPAVLSPSRALDFLQCPLLFRFRTIDRLPEEPKPAAVRGTLVHAVLERLYELPAPDRTQARALELVGPEWEALQENQPQLRELFDDASERTSWLEEARRAVRRYFTMEDPGRLEPHRRELRLEVTLESGLRLRGYVDRLDVASAGIRVVDYKTGRAPHPKYTDKSRLQIYLYALMVWRELGEIPRRLQLMFLGDGGWLWYEPTEQELLDVEAEITGIWRRIEATAHTGDWRPKRSKLCAWCDHQAHCPEFGGTPPPLPQESSVGRSEDPPG
ncbi:PD-(D/E)XK nuclease family protein [Lipingzhangella sp. LS1_29]|uniref:PD-(D/E)XK nuclease family protein n=1 Tax=Lipingzhangella rawalii TaxID=2055835 RepID=A0ABU2H0V5_9ACTN|nr:PD-(D/E)XK nuclease family protein [Lipingzhangella rawalii]MDS1268934.1 PD-(D/E)XK nuclease family protein [Lipingzhangella rawalii]